MTILLDFFNYKISASPQNRDTFCPIRKHRINSPNAYCLLRFEVGHFKFRGTVLSEKMLMRSYWAKRVHELRRVCKY